MDATEKPRRDRKPKTPPVVEPDAEGTVLYRVLAPCRVGRFRAPGETFAWPVLDPMPSYLERADASPAEGRGPEKGRLPAPSVGFTPVPDNGWIPPWELKDFPGADRP